MVNRQMFPAVRFDVAKRGEERVGFALVARAWVGRDVLQRIDLTGAGVLATDDAAGFARRVAPRLRDELGELNATENHTRAPPTIVHSTRVAKISRGGTVKMSRDRTMASPKPPTRSGAPM